MTLVFGYILLLPTYCAPIVQYAAMAQSKEAVFEICDNYQKQSYRTRLKMATANGLLTLNIPIKHSGDNSGRQATADVCLENDFHWQRDHWRSLKIAYRTSPYFEFYEEEFAHLYEQPYEKLLDFNLACHEVIHSCLQLDVKFSLTEEYFRVPKQKDLRVLANAKKKIPINFPEYNQVFGDRHGFLPNLSILDLLFNKGPESLSYLETLELDF